MDDKRVFLAALLSTVILLIWWGVFAPKPTEQPLPTAEASRPEQAEEASRSTPEAPAEEPAIADAPDPALTDPIEATLAEEIPVRTSVFEVLLTNEGARALSWKLIDYKNSAGEPLEVLPRFAGQRPNFLTLDLDDASLAEHVNGVLYQVERFGSGGTQKIRFTYADGHGVEVRKTLTFADNDYRVGVDLEVVDRGRRVPARVVLGPDFGASDLGEAQSSSYYAYRAVSWNNGGRVTHKKKKSFTSGAGQKMGQVRWAGLTDQYFAALVIPVEPQADFRWRPVELTRLAGEEDDAKTEKVVSLAVGVPDGGAEVFVGPKKFTLLRAMGGDLEKAVWFSSYSVLDFFARWIFLGLLWLHDNTVQNYGMAIILSTFLLRLLLFPVNQYSMVSMKKTQMQMSKLQPKIKALKNKYKKAKDAESRTKMNQEMMALYKREGVNPMGGVNGCIPMLAQFPILIGFFLMLTVAVELRGAPFFGWIHDLSAPDPWRVLPVVMGVTMFLQQKMAMTKIKDPVQQQQQKIMMLMPFFFAFLCMSMPAGMVLYWFVSNVLGIGQQWLVNRHTSRLEQAEQRA